MHIILANQLFGHGGIALYNRTMAAALVAQGQRVTILTAQRSGGAASVEEWRGVRIVYLSSPRLGRYHRLPGLGRYLRSVERIIYSWRAAACLRGLEPAEVVEFADVDGEGYFYLRSRPRAAVVVRCHNPLFVSRDYYSPAEMPFDTRLTAGMEKFCIRQAEALTAPSNAMAQIIAARCDISPERIQTIPNALAVNDFSPNLNSLVEAPAGGVLILYVGRLERVKGVGVLEQLIPLVLQNEPQARFVCIGLARSEALATSWKTKLEAAGPGRVKVVDFQDQNQVVPWYQCADVAVVPSLSYESFSYTCAQAMAAGLPVVASRQGGIPETVDDGRTGILCQPDNAAEFAAALTRLAQDKALRERLGRAGREKAQTQFDAPRVAAQMLRVYQSMA